jgi:hypothetical protein
VPTALVRATLIHVLARHAAFLYCASFPGVIVLVELTVRLIGISISEWTLLKFAHFAKFHSRRVLKLSFPL